jgi:hypothetical protein
VHTCWPAGSSSLYAAKSFKAGDALSEFGPKVVVTTPNYLTVQVGQRPAIWYEIHIFWCHCQSCHFTFMRCSSVLQVGEESHIMLSPEWLQVT